MKKLTVGDLIVKNQGAIKEATDKILKEEGLTAVINFCKDSLIPGRQILLTKEGMTFTIYDRGVFTIDGNGDPVKPLLNFEKEMDYSASMNIFKYQDAPLPFQVELYLKKQ